MRTDRRRARYAGRLAGTGALLLAAWVGLSGCSPVQEPWVAGPDQLEEERSRSPGQDKALRERARRVQGAY